MFRIVHIYRHQNGPRVWICGQRIHHGAVGIVLAAAATAAQLSLLLVAISAVLVAHDAHDWRWWFVREGLPAGVWSAPPRRMNA